MDGSSVKYLDETELEERISEIRAMARDAREKEKTERGEGDEESRIEKEIGARLSKLEKRQNSKREQLSMNYLSLFGIEEDESEISDGGLKSKEDEKLMFKKKYRFRSPSVNSMNSPKGFSGSSNGNSSISLNGTLGCYEQLNSSQIDKKKFEKQMEESQKEIQSGAVQGTNEGRLSSEGTNYWKSGDLGKQNSKSLRKENQRTTTKFDGPASSSINGITDYGKRQVADKLPYKQSDVQTNLWWLKLPYVLGILMRKGSEHEGAGLYTLRTLFADDEGDSYTIAFEDRGDANNFCYLLDSYFEDLEDFSADIVPLSVKEIHEAVKSGSKNVIVVKKGQLKLYAGQPFAEVEIALHALLE